MPVSEQGPKGAKIRADTSATTDVSPRGAGSAPTGADIMIRTAWLYRADSATLALHQSRPSFPEPGW